MGNRNPLFNIVEIQNWSVRAATLLEQECVIQKILITTAQHIVRYHHIRAACEFQEVASHQRHDRLGILSVSDSAEASIPSDGQAQFAIIKTHSFFFEEVR